MFSNLPALKELDLRGNMLARLDLHLGQPPMDSLRNIYLNENLWDCDALTSLLSYLTAENKNYNNYIETSNDTDLQDVGGINCTIAASLRHISQLEKTQHDQQIGLYITILGVMVYFSIVLSAVLGWSVMMHSRYARRISRAEEKQ